MTTPDNKQPPDDGNGELMYVKCAYCGAWMDVKPGHLNTISHGLCQSCYATEMAKLDQRAQDTE